MFTLIIIRVGLGYTLDNSAGGAGRVSSDHPGLAARSGAASGFATLVISLWFAVKRRLGSSRATMKFCQCVSFEIVREVARMQPRKVCIKLVATE